MSSVTIYKRCIDTKKGRKRIRYTTWSTIPDKDSSTESRVLIVPKRHVLDHFAHDDTWLYSHVAYIPAAVQSMSPGKGLETIQIATQFTCDLTSGAYSCAICGFVATDAEVFVTHLLPENFENLPDIRGIVSALSTRRQLGSWPEPQKSCEDYDPEAPQMYSSTTPRSKHTRRA